MSFAYPHGGDIYAAGISAGSPLLDFSANINPLGLPDVARQAYAGCLDACVHYPDPYCRALTTALSESENLPADQIVCGNGAADLIWRVALGRKPGKALLPAPTFADYAAALRAVGASLLHYPLAEETGFALQDNILDYMKNVDITFLCNPNNPTGRLTSPDLLIAMIKAAGQNGSLLIVDECFLDFVEGGERFSAKPFLSGNPHVVVLKAFTKFYAMPGLRLGYALTGDAALADTLRLAGQPWAVSTPAQAVGRALLETATAAWGQKTRALLAAERPFLAGQLKALGFFPFPAYANFILFKSFVPNLKEKLLPHGILIRDCANFPGLSNGYYRIAVKTHSENETLLAAFSAVLKEEAR